MRAGRPIVFVRDDPELGVADAFGELCGLFCEAAIQVWSDLEDTRNSGAALSEDSITDYLLLNMRRRSEHVAYYRYNRHEESGVSGADWLWLFIENGRGFPLLMQAKRLYSSIRYEGLKHAPRKRKDQLNLLERYARQRGFYPVVCFYNQWPSSQAWADRKFEGDVRLWGCAVAKSPAIKGAMRAGAGNSLANIGPLTFPWHLLTCPGPGSGAPGSPADLPERVRDRVIRHFGGRGVPEVRRYPPNIRSLLADGVDALDVGEDMKKALTGVVVVGAEPNKRVG